MPSNGTGIALFPGGEAYRATHQEHGQVIVIGITVDTDEEPMLLEIDKDGAFFWADFYSTTVNIRYSEGGNVWIDLDAVAEGSTVFGDSGNLEMETEPEEPAPKSRKSAKKAPTDPAEGVGSSGEAEIPPSASH